MKEKKASLFSIKYFLYDFCRFFVIWPGLLIFRPKYIYENEAAKEKIRGGALVVSNHIKAVDPLFLMVGLWYRRQHFVIAKEFMEKKPASIVFKVGQTIAVDRENYNLDSFRTIVDKLKEGRIVTIFAEGHINHEEKLDSFKSGMVLMSSQSQRPIVPVYIKKRNHFYERLTFVIGEKIELDCRDGKRPNLVQINRMTEEIREKENILKAIGDGRNRDVY